eukprot:TRINITY_DN3320_c0_g1_i1.p1 TRINITY_DN3320_c0_g1~~TRINITY_DN3320_c0_g1_i1.p1  ORF type:complete len:307 (+),score=59.99 TRINITY_DN3320_c0_g1_i1:49-969(+)
MSLTLQDLDRFFVQADAAFDEFLRGVLPTELMAWKTATWDLKCSDWGDFFGGHTNVAWAFAVAYLVIIFWLRDEVMPKRNPFVLKAPLALWNLFLCVFSVIGALRVAPRFYTLIAEDGLKGSVCLHAYTWCNDSTGWWALLFILSKIPELIDTLFLALRKKPIIFLHWYHHVTVLLYCWHAGYVRSANGIWFACMNLIVHSVMYFYYFLQALDIRPTWGKFVTIIQISQMFVGVFVTGLTAYYHFNQPEDCPYIDRENTVYALLMYSSYLLLFVQFFLQKDYTPKAKAAKPDAAAADKSKQKSKQN